MVRFDITSLRLFVAVVEQSNIAQASRLNNIAASAISKRISDLEASIGAPLLRRLKDGVEPTPAGLATMRYASEIQRLLAELEVELSEFAGGAKGQVRLWANMSAVT